MLHRRDDARFPPEVTLGFQAKEFNLEFIRPENLVFNGLRVLYWSFGKLQAGYHVPFTESRLPSGNITKKPLFVECGRDGCPSGRCPHFHRGTLELCQSDHWVLGHLPDQGPFKKTTTFISPLFNQVG